MAVASKQVTVSAAAAAVLVYAGTDGAGERQAQVTVKNTGANAVHLGPAGVTASTGLSVAASSSVQVLLGERDALYVFSTSGSTIEVLATNQ